MGRRESYILGIATCLSAQPLAAHRTPRGHAGKKTRRKKDMAKYSDQPERPRAEPEIIPPDRSGGPGRRDPAWPPPDGFTPAYGTQRVYVGRIGPFGFALLLLVIGFLAAVMLLI